MEQTLRTTIASYDLTAADYAEKTLKIDTGAQVAKFTSYLEPGSLILDAGCGPGRDAKRFTDLGHHVVGIDLSSALLRIAQKHAPDADFLMMDLTHLYFPQAHFDGVWAMSSLMHLHKEKLPRALMQCHHVMKPGAPFYFCLKRGEGEGLETDKRYGVEKYFAYYSDEDVQQLIAGTPFEVLERSSTTIDTSYATNPWMDIYLRKP